MSARIDDFFKPLSASTSSQSRKRPRDDDDEPTVSKQTETPPKSKLEGSTMPAWTDQNPNLSMTAPTSPNAQKCIEKWGLLAPFDTSITDEKWGIYFNERERIEAMNTPGDVEFKRINSEELMQNPERLLRDARNTLEKVILGSCLGEVLKAKVASVFKKSLYYLQLWGNEEDGSSEDEYNGRSDFSPRTVSSETRLYSPFGTGASFDFKYYYHSRFTRAYERFSALVVRPREIQECDPASFKCAAGMKGSGVIGPPEEGSTTIFYWTNMKSTTVTIAKMADLERTLFACSGLLSPRLLFDLLCAGGTADIYQEEDTSDVKYMRQFFKLFPAESYDIGSDD